MRTKIMIVLSIVVLVVLNYSIYENEQIITHGETVLLKLGPVDPRSLMQGDYMRLRYSIEDAEQVKELAPSRGGYMVVRPDEHNVAQFVRFYNQKKLAAGERLLHFRRQRSRVRVVPNSFFFQEGNAKYYQDAEYGVFRFDGAGKYLLVGLADTNRKLIVVE